MGKRRGGGCEREDQYGGFGSQDKDSFQNFSQKSSTGGGKGGSQSRHKAGHDLAFQRHVPKFLQKYSHLLGKGQGGQPGNEDGADEDAPVVVGAVGKKGKFDGWDDEEDEDPKAEEDIEEDALRRAMEDNPDLAKEFEGKLQEKLNQARAKEEKDKGNRAFSEKKYDVAIKHFTSCIDLDPGCEVYWSNRSAAQAALQQWEPALSDARKAVQLKPNWAKAHSRMAVAFFGLNLYSDAKEAYERALKLEPEDAALRKGLEKAEYMEFQQVRDKKHVFFKKAKLNEEVGAGNKQPVGQGRDGGPGAGGDKGQDASRGGATKEAGGGKGGKAGGAKLSFAEDDEDA